MQHLWPNSQQHESKCASDDALEKATFRYVHPLFGHLSTTVTSLPRPGTFFRSGRRSMHSLLFWPLENNNLSITEAAPKANPKSQILPLDNGQLLNNWRTQCARPHFLSKKSDETSPRGARLCSLLWFGFYIIGIFSIVLRRIYRLQYEVLQMKCCTVRRKVSYYTPTSP